MAAGIGLLAFAGLSNGDVWKEFYQYFRESRFVSTVITCIRLSTTLSSTLIELHVA